MADLPHGTVTFLFTDIEGSTALWERDRTAMQAAIERHFELLRAACEGHHGFLYKTVGDGTQSAFASAAAAVRAALAAQRSLLAEPWPDPPGPLRVRMALHAGQAEPRGNDYLAAPLNRLSRLLAIGSGGQILLTEIVQQLAQDDLPAGTTLRYLGAIALRDLDRPEQVFALEHHDFPRHPGLLANGTARAHNFPALLTPFLERETELATTEELLLKPGVRLVTLTGPGGIGKTRLAHEVGLRLAGSFADGAAFIDLGTLRDPALVIPSIARVLGLQDMGSRPLAERVVEFLRQRQMLLVLDNFEQVIAAAPQVTELLATCPSLKVLVTSRAVLHVSGEHELPVPPLALPRPGGDTAADEVASSEAVQLFVARARAARPGFALTETNAAAVATICRQLDGLPLAIELAAARIAHLPPAALLARLEQRLPLLTGGPRDLPTRLQTMRDAIAWSYDLLSSEEQRLFRHLGVFRGGFTLEAAEASCPPLSPSIFEVIASLVDKSLLRPEDREDEPRYRMLETIGEFSREQLVRAGEDEAACQAHAAYFLALAQQAAGALHGPDVIAWLDRMESERDNLRGASDWLAHRDPRHAAQLAIALHWFWRIRGPVSEGRRWTERLLLEAGTLPPDLRVHLLVRTGDFANIQGDRTRAVAVLDEALTLARDLGDPSTLGLALIFRGVAAQSQGQLDQARRLHEEARLLRGYPNEQVHSCWFLDNLGTIAWRSGDAVRATALHEQALAVAKEIGFAWSAADILTHLGHDAFALGDHARAASLYRESLRRQWAIGIQRDFAGTLAGFAGLAVALGHPDRAAGLCGAIDALLNAIGVTHAPAGQAAFDQTVATACAALGEAKFAELRSAGRHWPSERILAEVEGPLTFDRSPGSN